MLDENFICLETITGSHAYGASTPESDTDYRGIFIPDKSSFLGCLPYKEQYETKSPDRVIYDIRKYLRLAIDCNPNILELLNTRDCDIVKTTEVGEILRSHRDVFLTKQCKQSYLGYSRAQLRRIKTHRGWLLNPPKKKPERVDFGLPEHKRLVPKDWVEAVSQSDYSEEDNELIAANTQLIEYAKKEKSFKDAMMHWNSYLHWKDERNPKRAELEAKFGFDTKHAQNLLRLTIQAEEILSGKGLLVFRPDRQFLLDIRNGKYSYDEIEEFANRQELRINEAYEKSTLPEKCDVDKVNELCVELVSKALKI